jgi:RHS repeat-associated protein
MDREQGCGPVYYDKIMLKHYKGQVLEEDHYYPFGLMLSTTTANPAEQNNIKFQTQRLESDLGLNWYDYKYRMHDMQIGRFTTIDPLAEQFPNNSLYAFSQNMVTKHIELEGLEAIDVNTNKVINDFSPSNLPNIPQNSTMPWCDLMNFGPSQTVINQVHNRNPSVSTQYLRDAYGSKINLDYYSVNISKLPPGVVPEVAFNYLRKNFGDFKTGMSAYSSDDEKVWESNNPTSAVMRFRASPNDYGVPYDDLSVIASESDPNYWLFSTASSFKDHGHAVSGTRQFGFTANDNGSYTFFTRGVDRAHVRFDEMNDGKIFGGGDKL